MKKFIYISDLVKKYDGFHTLNNLDLFSLGFFVDMILGREINNREILEDILFDIDNLAARKDGHEEKNHTATFFEIEREIEKLM